MGTGSARPVRHPGHRPETPLSHRGSTSHAPGGVFQNNPSRTVSTLAQWTVNTFLDVSNDGHPTYFPVGSLEIATTEARWADLHRKAGYATSWGLDARLLDPASTGELLPHLDTSLIYGSIRVARDGIVRAIPTVERIAARAKAAGVSFIGETTLTGVRIERGRVVESRPTAATSAASGLSSALVSGDRSLERSPATASRSSPVHTPTCGALHCPS
ncbi:MAG: FAD-dependent oxidoreductase [Thermomicrobiales bacterium]